MGEPGAEEPDQLLGVLGRGHGHAGHREHVGDVVEPHVGLPVLAHQPRAVHAEEHRQLLHRDVVDDVVVGPLQEGAVDGADRPDALGGEPARERDCVPLGDAHVEEAAGPLLLEDAGPGARRHRRGDHHEPGDLRGEAGERLAEELGPGRRAAGLLPRLAGLRIIRREPVPLLLVRLGEREALPLLGQHVDHPGALEPADEAQRLAELLHVVAVDRAEVPEAELLEEHPGGKEVLGALLDVLREFHQALAEDVPRLEGQVLDRLPHPVGERARDEAAQRLADGADVGRDRHPVVVDDEEDVTVGVAGVVHPLVGEAAGEGAVAHHRDDLVPLPLEVARGGHAERGGHRGAGVAGAELVVGILAPLEEPRDPAGLAEGSEAVVPPGEQLPGVGLVAHVPDDLVTGRVEFVEQRDGELDAAEARADVPAGDGARFDEPVADLLGELRKLLAAEALEVLGAVNACQECHASPGQGG